MSEQKNKKSLIKQILRIALYAAVALFIIYTIAGFFIVPMIIKSEAVDYIKEEFKRDAEIESVSFNPFAFTLSVEGFKMYEKEKEETFFSFKEFFINVSLLPLLSKEVNFEEIKLTEPDGNIIRYNEEEFNFSDLIETAIRQNTDSVEVAEEDEPWEIFIQKFDLQGLHLQITDKAVNPPGETRIDSFSVTVTNLRFNSSDTSDFYLTSNLRHGGSFSLSGNFSMTPLKADLNFSLDQASLKPLAPYVAQFAYLRLDDGLLSIDGSIKIDEPDPSKKMDISFTANTSITNLILYDTKHDERFLEWNSLTVSDISGQLNPMLINIGDVNLKKLYTRIAIAEDKGINLIEVLKESPVLVDSGQTSDTLFIKSADTKKEQMDFNYDIGSIKIENSEMYFSDLSLPLQFASKIHQLNGEVIGFSSENPLGAEIKMEGTVDEYGLAKIKGKMDPFDPIAYSDIKMNFHNIEMTNLTPYSIDFIGYHLESGKLSLDVEYKIDNGILTSYSKVFLNKFTLGDEVEGEEGLGLPIKLAIALLKDADGNIDLDLEVEGDLNDPETDTGALVWWAVKRVLTTIVTAPFRFLGGLLGIGGEDLESVDFEVGSAELENHQFEKMISLSKIMAERPGIVLEIYGAVDTVTDGLAMREAKFDSVYNQRLTGKTGADTTASQKKTDYTKGQGILEEMYVQANNDSLLNLVKVKFQIDSAGNGDLRNYLEELRQKLISTQPISEMEFQNIATTRAEAIRNHMMTVHQIPPERIAIKENEIFEEEDRNWVRCRLGIGSLD
ncbi:MAG: DUF748 domain-containing protein [Ignavibacteriaceae bacterium]|nr:DUF748 domain-containing protein [Ignavibacteriaceae bacterium]